MNRADVEVTAHIYKHMGRLRYWVRWRLWSDADACWRLMDTWNGFGGATEALDQAERVRRQVASALCRENPTWTLHGDTGWYESLLQPIGSHYLRWLSFSGIPR